MIFRRLWERYIFSELLKMFLFFIFSFYLLYILIDYSIHARHFSKIPDLKWIDIGTYYFYLFIKRLDLVLPLALLIALNKVLLYLNQKNELMALFVGGLKKIQLLRPFFLLAFLITLLTFFNFEWMIPRSLDYLETFENKYFRKNVSQNFSSPSAYCIFLDHGGKIFFRSHHISTHSLEDVFYVESLDSIWKMQSLTLYPDSAKGSYVEHLVRDDQGLLVKDHSYDTHLFSHLIINLSSRKKMEIPFEHRSLFSLYSFMRAKSPLYQENASKIQTHFFFKLVMPFISFLVIIACAPFCMIFSRKLPIFMIYAMSIFGVVAFFTMMDTAVILGENHLLSPLLAITIPFLLCLGGFGLKFINTYSK
jgi:lipopolysaccharide export system permease protein